MINKNKNNKASVDMVFVYIFSIIIIVFAGFLVSKFIFNFTEDTDLRHQTKFYENFKKDFDNVYRNYGSEKTLNYYLTTDVTYVCFISNKNCISSIDLSGNISNFNTDNVLQLYESGSNIIIFDRNDIISSNNIGDFSASNNGCLCVKTNNMRIELLMENLKNKVYLDKIE